MNNELIFIYNGDSTQMINSFFTPQTLQHIADALELKLGLKLGYLQKRVGVGASSSASTSTPGPSLTMSNSTLSLDAGDYEAFFKSKSTISESTNSTHIYGKHNTINTYTHSHNTQNEWRPGNKKRHPLFKRIDHFFDLRLPEDVAPLARCKNHLVTFDAKDYIAARQNQNIRFNLNQSAGMNCKYTS